MGNVISQDIEIRVMGWGVEGEIIAQDLYRDKGRVEDGMISQDCKGGWRVV